MKKARILPFLMGVAAVLSLWGCGSDNRETSSQPAQVVASQRCIGCHNTNTSPVTGANIFQEWQRSAHASANGGAGCDDCHHVDGHPENGTVPPLPTGIECLQCHGNTQSLSKAHFSNISASYMGVSRAQANVAFANPVMPRGALGCNGCHNPHDVTTILPVNRQWAQSAHANVEGEAFKETVFLKRNPCSRCHSTTGYRYYMTNGQKIVTTAVLGQYTSAKEVVNCNACHADYSWKRLTSTPTFVNFSTPYVRFDNISKRFPSNIGDTIICVGCHGGREGRVGAAVSAATNSPTDPHYFPAAGVMYMKIGFINFTSLTAPVPGTTTTYGSTLISTDDGGSVNSIHRQLGTPAIRTFNNNVLQGKFEDNGPCVTCHMTAGHTFKITGDTFNQLCVNCHSSELGTPLTAANFEEVFIEENRQQMNDALSLAVKLLERNYDISVRILDITSPEGATFIRKSTGAAINWTGFTFPGGVTPTAKQLKNLKGAMFNVAIGYKLNSSFLHARTYTRRLIYDAIDWLDNEKMDLSVRTTALDPAIGGTVLTNTGSPAFARGTTAYIIANGEPAALAPGTTGSMTWLLGFSRTTGAWNAVDRP